MKLELNREFALRYLFVAVLMLGMGGWFGYDGYVKYPSMTATELYASHHGGKAADSEAAAIKHQQQAIPRQKQFMTLCLVASALVALVLIKAARMRFSYDDEGFEYKSKRYLYSDIVSVDLKHWRKKGIMTVHTADAAIRLDAWHHKGVDGFYGKVSASGSLERN